MDRSGTARSGGCAHGQRLAQRPHPGGLPWHAAPLQMGPCRQDRRGTQSHRQTSPRPAALKGRRRAVQRIVLVLVELEVVFMSPPFWHLVPWLVVSAFL